MKQKSLILMAAVLILAFIASAGYFAYKNYLPKTQILPASNWKTYTNTKYNFSFKYPQDYTIKTSDEITGATPFIIFIYPDSTLNNLLLTFNFDQSKTNALADHGEIKTDQPSEMPTITVGTTNYPIIKFLTEEGVPGYGNCMNSTSSIRYVANTNNFAVTIQKQKEVTCNSNSTQNILKETTDQQITTANQILSTFKFTN